MAHLYQVLLPFYYDIFVWKNLQNILCLSNIQIELHLLSDEIYEMCQVLRAI